MAGSVVRVAIVGDNSSLKHSLEDSHSGLKKFGKAAAAAGIAAGVVAAAGMVKFGKAAVEQAREAQKVGAQTEAVLKSTGGAAGVTAKQVGDLANAISAKTGIDDEAIQSGENLLLTFKNVRNEVGAGNDIFNQATQIMTDMSAALGQDGKSSAIQLGKALNDPIKGITALSRVGVTFTEKQKATIKSLTESGHSLKAQKMILKELNSEFGGSAAAQATAGDKMKVAWENLQETVGTALLPVLDDLENTLSSKVIPAISEWVTKNQDKIREWAQKVAEAAKAVGELAVAIGKNLWPALKLVGGIIVSLIGWFNGLPNPIKKIGVEAAAAAVLIWKLKPAFDAVKASATTSIAQVRQFGAEMTYPTQRAATLKGALEKLGPAAKAAAGVGGMVLLAQGAQETNKKLSLLETTAGGAATGFAVGGPWGAAIGGAAGLMLGLAKNTKSAGEAAQNSVANWDSLKSSLDQVTGAQTEASKAAIFDALQRAGTITSMQKLGINARTLVGAVAGEAGARRQVNAVLAQSQGLYDQENAKISTMLATRDRLGTQLANDLNAAPADRQRWQDRINAIDQEIPKLNADAQARKNDIDSIKKGIGQGKAATQEIRQRTAATRDLTGKLHGIPKAARTKIIADGIIPTTKAIAELARRYRLTPKQIRTLIKASGADTTVKAVERVKKKLDEVSKTKADIGPFRSSFLNSLVNMTGSAKGGGKRVGEAAKQGVKDGAKPDLSKFKSGIRTGIDGARGTASTGGHSVGAALSSGVAAGIAVNAADARSAALVNNAIAAARHAAQAKSPSKKTKRLGRDLAAGLVVGLQEGSQGVSDMLEKLTNQTTAYLASALADRERAIRKHLKGKAETKALRALDHRWAGHVRAVKNATKDERNALQSVGREQDALTGGNYLPYLKAGSKLAKDFAAAQLFSDDQIRNLSDATTLLKTLTDQMHDYAAQVKQSFVDFGDVTNLGKQDDGTVLVGDLLDQLSTRAVQAQRFAGLIRQFKGQGLSDTVIQQLLAAGPEAAAATAEAIAQGGQAAVNSINALTGQIAAAGGQLGTQMSQSFYGAGVNAAQGLVNGLTARQVELDAAAESMARALVRAVKKALKIKSPSGVFKTLGSQVSAGLALGIDDTHASRAGTSMANSLVSGFGRPTLSANAISGTSSARTQVEVKLTAQQVSQLERGRAIQMDLDQYRSAGGRSRA